MDNINKDLTNAISMFDSLEYDNTNNSNITKNAQQAQANQRIQAEKVARDNALRNNYTHFQAWEDAKKLNRISYSIDQWKSENRFEENKDFLLTTDMLKEANIPHQWWSEFNNVASQEQFDEVWTNIQAELDARYRLDNMGGFAGFAYEAGVSVTDPAQLAIAVASAPVAAVSKGGKLAQLGRSFAQGTAEGAMVGALINQGLHTYTATDMLTEAALTGFFNAGLTGLTLPFVKNDVELSTAPLEQTNVSAQTTDLAQKNIAYTNRIAMIDEEFNTGEMMNFVDNWKNQRNKFISDIDKSSQKIAKQEKIMNETVINNPQATAKIAKMRENVEQLKIKHEEKINKANTISKEIEDYEALQPIEQMAFVSEKRQGLFSGYDDNFDFTKNDDYAEIQRWVSNDNAKRTELNDSYFNAKKEADKYNEQLEILENNRLKAINNKDKKKIKAQTENIENFKAKRPNVLKDFEEAKKAKEDFDKKPFGARIVQDNEIDLGFNFEEINIEKDLLDDSLNISKMADSGGSVGAAKTRDVEDFSTFAERNEGANIENLKAKQEQEAIDNVGENVNAGILKKGVLRNLATNQEKLNRLGGNIRVFGRAIFGDIATKQNTKQLQKTYFEEGFNSVDLVKQKEQLIQEVSSVNGKAMTEKEVFNAYSKYMNGYGEENLKATFDKFNNATEAWYAKYNRVKQVSVEMDKQFIQREYANKFQAIFESTDTAGDLTLTQHYRNEFGAYASRNAGTSAGRNDMMKHVFLFGKDSERFDNIYPNVSKEYRNAVKKASEKQIALYKEMGENLIKEGLDPTGIIANSIKNNDYLPHNWNGSRFNRADQNFGNEQIIDLFAESIQKANPNSSVSKTFNAKVEKGELTLEEATAKSKGKPVSRLIAEALVNGTLRRHRSKIVTDTEIKQAFEVAMNDLGKYLKDYKDEISASMEDKDFKLLERFINQEIESKTSKSGLEAKRQERIKIDVYHEKQLTNKEDFSKSNVRIFDFLDTNSESVMQTYINTYSSSVAFGRKGVKSKDDLRDMLIAVEQDNNAIKDRAELLDATDEDIAMAKLALSDDDIQFYKDISNHLFDGTSPIDYTNTLNKSLHYLGQYNFMRMMGKMSIAQMSELSEIAHQAGISTMFKSMPSFGKMFKSVGKMSKIERESFEHSLESFGFVTDNYSAQFFNDIGDDLSLMSFTDYDDPFTKKATRQEQLVSMSKDMFHKGSRYSGLLSSKMDKFTRTWAVKSAFSELDSITRFFVGDNNSVDFTKRMDRVLSQRGINQDTLIEYGLTLQDLPVIKEAFDKYAKFTTSSKTGNRVIESIDLGQMVKDNHPAFNKLRDFSVLAQNEVVAPSTIGNSYKSLVNNQIVKTIFQFRTYGLQSLDHKLRSKLRTNNNVSMYLLYGAFTGAMSYTLNVLANAPKYENSDEYIQDRLSAGNLAAGSFSRSVYAYLFPALLGSVEEMTTGSNHFGQSTRTSGMANSLTDIPLTDLINNVGKLGTNTTSYFTGQDEEGLKKALRNLTALLPVAAAPLLGEGLKVGLQNGKTYEK